MTPEEALRILGPVHDVQQRPWGVWADWHRTPGLVVKCMSVQPGARMSLQRHQHREEVWHVISGLGEDQGRIPSVPLVPGRTYVVKPGQVHRIANTGDAPLVIVEVQVGAPSESDIERLHDDYQRAP